ncbi:MAG: N-acetyl-gamma-glutamyl-phosphate reductase [Gemmataceae bacterium]
MIKVAVLGGSGYTALELIKILLRHPKVKIEAVTSRQEGTPLVSEQHPALTGRIQLRMEPLDVDRLVARGVQCAFGCLPHGVSMESLPPLLERGLRVIDLSADYRLRDPNTYAQWYGEDHHDLAHLTHAVYGLPEIYGDDIPAAQLVANPGCYPQTAILGLAPLVAGKYIDLGSIIIDSKSGVSGGGRTPKLAFHFPECNESFSAYGVGNHRHTPEIEQALSDIAGEPVEVIFTPHLVPMDRGIFSTIYATPKRGMSEEQVFELYREYFRAAPVRARRQTLAGDEGHGATNFLDISVRTVSRPHSRPGRGEQPGARRRVAVQNFNRMYGFEETTGLL